MTRRNPATPGYGYDPKWSNLHTNKGLDGAIIPHLDRLNAAGHHTSSSCQGGFRRRGDRKVWPVFWPLAMPGWVWTWPHLAIHTNTLEEAQELGRQFREDFTRNAWDETFCGMLSVRAITMDWSTDCWFDYEGKDVPGMSDIEAWAWWDAVTVALCRIPSVAPMITTYQPPQVASWETVRAAYGEPRS